MGLQKRLEKACYRRIRRTLDQYEAETDISRSVALMDPRLYAEFATRACTDVARVVAEDSGGSEVAIHRELAPCLRAFVNALQKYTPAFNRMQQVAGQAHEVAIDQGLAIGEWASSTFGGMAGLLVGAASGYLTGQALEREFVAEAKKAEKAFNVMLKAYDAAMEEMIDCVIDLLDR